MVTLKYITGTLGIIISILVTPSIIKYIKLEDIEETDGFGLGVLGVWIEAVSLILQLTFWQHNWNWLMVVSFILSVIAFILLIAAKIMNNYYLYIMDEYIKYRSYTGREKIIYYKYITDAIVSQNILTLYENKDKKPVIRINIKNIGSCKYESIVEHLSEHDIKIIYKS